MTTTAPTSTAPSVSYGPSAERAEPRGLGIASLVLGIVSILTGGGAVVGPIAGLALGIVSLSREPGNRTMAVWGIVLNAVVLGFAALAALGTVALALFALPFALF
ncbi:hypothetical protein [Agromyces mangrovi Wang et al. 2018]|uniref:hypothetical protein n=1 Tax=Agromyces mangrovi TaxID=1858653 RepID=UPI0025740582|nr:hypothetical protein [Agromyces mangrovi]BDZ66002.1 hypothetical protein GCM10025877_29400 [Agromyces mangrovi]